jgi:hypothetical protein
MGLSSDKVAPSILLAPRLAITFEFVETQTDTKNGFSKNGVGPSRSPIDDPARSVTDQHGRRSTNRRPAGLAHRAADKAARASIFGRHQE